MEISYFNFRCFYPVSCFNFMHNTVCFICSSSLFYFAHLVFLHDHVLCWIDCYVRLCGCVCVFVCFLSEYVGKCVMGKLFCDHRKPNQTNSN